MSRSSPPTTEHRFRGMRLEQTVPPRAPSRSPSPALRDSSRAHNRPSYTPMMNASASPAASLRSSGSSWENRGHRSPPTAQSPFPAEREPRERHTRSISPRHNMRPEPFQRARTPPALEPAPLRVSPRTQQHSPGRVYTDRQLQPSDAERRREAEQQQQQQKQQQKLAQQNPYSSRTAQAAFGLASPPPERPLPALPVQITAQEIQQIQGDVSPSSSISSASSSSLNVSPITPLTTRSKGHGRAPSAGEANLMKIGAPRARRAPRTHVPSMCDYPSLAELEGLWAQQDCFLGSVTAPQSERPGAGINMHSGLRGPQIAA